MKDFFGNPLSLGDNVAFCQPGYRNMVLGKIIAFTQKQVRVEYKVPGYEKRIETFLTYPSFFIKKPV